jgi:TetR/AcrR family tetracycline transcriptional repressor
MPLQREAVVRAALALLDEVGLDGLTVRRLAERLGVQNPALYWHFKNKQDLLDRMAEAMLTDAFATLGPPAPGETWSHWLTRVARTFRRALLSHRDGARVIAGANLAHSAMLDGLDLALRVLREAGFAGRDAFVGVLTIFDYTLGATFEEQAEPTRAAAAAPPDAAVSEALRASIDSKRLPTLAAVLDEVAGQAPDHDRALGFEGGLQLILAGMRAAHPAAGR